MKGPVTALVAAYGRVDMTEIEDVFAADPELKLAGVIENDSDWDSRSTYAADVLLIACSGPSDKVLSLIEQESQHGDAMPVIVICAGSANGFVRQVFQAGADDIIMASDLRASGSDISFAIQKAITRKTAPVFDATGAGGELICVLGPKGGTGKTLTSSNLAVALAAEGKHVALVDLDLQFGDLGLVMGIMPERSIFDLVTSGGTLDAEKIDSFLAKHSSGVRVLLAPSRPDQAAAVNPDFLRELYPLLRQVFDYVVVDTPPGFTPEVIATIDSASSVCLIGTLDAPSLKNAKLGAETLDLMGYPRDRMRIVLNRADTSVGVTHADVVAIFGRAPDVLVPSGRDVVRSVNAGEPIVTAHPRSEAAKAFRALAHVFIAAAAPVPAESGRRSRLGRS
jgi:pilus assembly protein CpaE